MINARHFIATETLKNGVTITLRAVRPDDKNGIEAAFRRLAPESRYTRFFQSKPSLSEEELEAAAVVDFENVVALVVTTTEAGHEIIIGGGRYIVLNPSQSPRSAEIAFLVEDRFQGQGIAGRILKHLAHIARAQGVSQFEADVLPQNRAMLGVFSRCGLALHRRPADGAIRITLSLARLAEPA